MRVAGVQNVNDNDLRIGTRLPASWLGYERRGYNTAHSAKVAEIAAPVAGRSNASQKKRCDASMKHHSNSREYRLGPSLRASRFGITFRRPLRKGPSILMTLPVKAFCENKCIPCGHLHPTAYRRNFLALLYRYSTALELFQIHYEQHVEHIPFGAACVTRPPLRLGAIFRDMALQIQ